MMDYFAELKHYDCVSRTSYKRINFLVSSVIQLYLDFSPLKGNDRKIGQSCFHEENLDTSYKMRLILLSIILFLTFVFSQPAIILCLLSFPSVSASHFRPFLFIVSFFSFGGEIKDYRAYIFSDGERSTTCECVSLCLLLRHVSIQVCV